MHSSRKVSVFAGARRVGTFIVMEPPPLEVILARAALAQPACAVLDLFIFREAEAVVNFLFFIIAVFRKSWLTHLPNGLVRPLIRRLSNA
jgi:hypothetical protein